MRKDGKLRTWVALIPLMLWRAIQYLYPSIVLPRHCECTHQRKDKFEPLPTTAAKRNAGTPNAECSPFAVGQRAPSLPLGSDRRIGRNEGSSTSTSACPCPETKNPPGFFLSSIRLEQNRRGVWGVIECYHLRVWPAHLEVRGGIPRLSLPPPHSTQRISRRRRVAALEDDDEDVLRTVSVGRFGCFFFFFFFFGRPTRGKPRTLGVAMQSCAIAIAFSYRTFFQRLF